MSLGVSERGTGNAECGTEGLTGGTPVPLRSIEPSSRSVKCAAGRGSAWGRSSEGSRVEGRGASERGARSSERGVEELTGGTPVPLPGGFWE